MSIDTEIQPATKRTRKMAREPKTEVADLALPKRQTKTDQVLDLLRRPEGATLEQLVAATGWLPHTARAALTGLKKKGHKVSSAKEKGGARVYHAVAA